MCTVSGVVEVARVAGGGGYWASGLVDQTGNVDAVVGEGVIGIGGVIPLHMGELAEVCQVIEGIADVSEKLGDMYRCCGLFSAANCAA